MKTVEKMAAREKKPFAARPAIIACLGDSVTHGCFELVVKPDGGIETTFRPQEGYEARLQLRLNRIFPAAAPCVVDVGVSGDSAGGGLSRLERDVLSLQPDLVIVNFGLNDACNADVEGGLAAYARNMRAIFEKVLSSGAECMLLTPNRMCSYVSAQLTYQPMRDIAERVAAVQNGGILTRYVDAAKAEAAECGVPVADAYARWQALERSGADTTAMLANFINHPRADMHDLFAALVLDQLFA